MDTKTREQDVTDRPQLTLIEQVRSLSELCAHLQVAGSDIYDLRSKGRGPRGFRVGRELRFRISEVEAWLERMEQDDERRHEPGGCNGGPTPDPDRHLRRGQHPPPR